MSALSPELLAQIRAIELRTRRLVTDAMTGDYKSAFRGQGMEFQEVREYQPGDDVRRIDWNVTARSHGNAYVKEHKEERELTVMLMVDVSASGRFGSGQRFVHEVAAEVAAVLAHVAMKGNDKVGLLMFSSEVEHYVPPKKGRAHLWRVIREILSYEATGHGTSLAAGLTFLQQVLRRRAVVFLLSDFLDKDYGDELLRVSKRHDLTALSLFDPRATELVPMGLVTLVDLEQGERVVVDTYDKATVKAIKDRELLRRAALSETLRAAGVGEIPVDVTQSYVHPIVEYFHKR